MGDNLDADVLIAGAGPVGLTLANLLGLYGTRAIVIERNPSTVQEPRAVSIDDESLRLMQAAGLDEAVLKDVVQGYGVEYYSWRGELFARVLPTRAEFGFPKRSAFRQVLFERTLREGLPRFPTVTALFEHELTAFEDTGDHVVARVRAANGEKTFRVRWLIGCDGGRSFVRDRCGIRLQGSTFAERWLIVDLEGDKLRIRDTQTFCDPERPAIRLPGPHRTLRYEFMLRAHEDEAFALDETRFRGWMAARHAEDGDLKLVRKVVYAFHARIAEHWRKGNVFLAGDAAHLSPPFAGQGLNSGLRDAGNLAWKLAAAARGVAPLSLLDSYEPERRPHAQALIRMALAIGRFMQPKTKGGAAVMQTALKLACTIPAARDYVLQLKFKPKPRLREGFFVASPHAPHSEMVPQPLVELPDGTSARLDDLLGKDFAVLGWDDAAFRADAFAWLPFKTPARIVALSRAGEDFGPSPQSDDVRLARDKSGVLEKFLDQLNAKAVIVRPDRYWWRVIPR